MALRRKWCMPWHELIYMQCGRQCATRLEKSRIMWHIEPPLIYFFVRMKTAKMPISVNCR